MSQPEMVAAVTQRETVLEVRHLTKYFRTGGLIRPGHIHALEDVSFAIGHQQIVALVGESGSGKSTTARLIARLMPPTKGEILFKGQNILSAEPRQASLRYRSKVQLIFQDPFGSLNPVHTVGYHLAQSLLIHKKVHGRRELQDQVGKLLTDVGLPGEVEFAQKYPHQLSGGQRQRVAIARALAVEPEIILADEPISMLDVSIRMGVLNLMERLKEERGIAYLYITHDIASARYVSDQIMVMYAGHMVEGAGDDDLVTHPAHPYTKLLLSAVPNPHIGVTKYPFEAHSEMPSLIGPPAGCPFAARCPQVMNVCREIMPGVMHVGLGHWVRCHLYGSDTVNQAAACISRDQDKTGGRPRLAEGHAER